MSGLLRALLGTAALVVGVEDDPQTGLVRMYLDHRSRGIYAIIEDPDAIRELRAAWANTHQHVIVDLPPPEVLWTERERP